MKSTAQPARLLLDANVIISGMRFTGPPYQLLEAGRAGTATLLAPEYVLREVRRILFRRFNLSDAAVDMGLAELPVKVIPNAPVALVRRAQMIIGDQADGAVLASAWEAGAEALVTGDAHFFTPAVQARVRVLTPREALGLIAGPTP